MTNREKLNRECMYDLLCRINGVIIGSGYICILEAITGQERKCPDRKTDISGYSDMCSYCIAAWLNEEVK